jgi:hypothetical protein
VSTPFHLPVGVHLLHVYMESKEFCKLQENSALVRSAFDSVASRKSAQKKVRPVRPVYYWMYLESSIRLLLSSVTMFDCVLITHISLSTNTKCISDFL